MTETSKTAKFFANSATIFSPGKAAGLANFVKIAGIAATVTVAAPTMTANNLQDRTDVAEIAVIDEINRVISLKRLNDAPNIRVQEGVLKTATTDKARSVNGSDVNAVTEEVTRLRLDDMNASNVYHQYGDYKVPHSVLKELVRAAKDADFPTDYLFGIVEKESRFDCNAAPPSGSARGCMQVIDQTWLRLVKQYGGQYGLSKEAELVELTYNKRRQPVYKVSDKEDSKRILDLRYDVYYAATLAVTDLKSAKSKIEKNLSAKFDDDNLYLPHFMGEDRAAVALAAYEKRPNAAASKIFHREAKANPGMFYNGKGRQRVSIDVAGFIKRAQDVILSRSAKYHNVEKVAQKNSLSFVLAENIPVPVAKPSISRDSFIAAMKSRIAKSKVAVLPPDNITPEHRSLDTDFQGIEHIAHKI